MTSLNLMMERFNAKTGALSNSAAAAEEAARVAGASSAERDRAVAAREAAALHETAEYWEPKDRLPFRKLVDLEDALRNDAADLAAAQDELSRTPKGGVFSKGNKPLQDRVLAASEKLRKTQKEHDQSMQLYFQYPGHWDDWDWRHREPSHVQGKGNLYRPGQSFGPSYSVQTPGAANLTSPVEGNHIVPVVPVIPLTPNQQRQKNRNNRSKSQAKRQESINSSVVARVNAIHVPRIKAAEIALGQAERALEAANEALRNHAIPGALPANNPMSGPAERAAALAAMTPVDRQAWEAAHRQLTVVRDAAQQEQARMTQALGQITQQYRNAVRNEKRRVGTVRNNRKAKRNANNAANAKAKNEMLPLPNFNNFNNTGIPLPEATPTVEVLAKRLPAARAALANAQGKYDAVTAPGSRATEETERVAQRKLALAQGVVRRYERAAREHNVNTQINTMFD